MLPEWMKPNKALMSYIVAKLEIHPQLVYDAWDDISRNLSLDEQILPSPDFIMGWILSTKARKDIGNMLPDWHIKRISRVLGVTEDSVKAAQDEMTKDEPVQYYLEKYPGIDKASALVGWIMCEMHFKREKLFEEDEIGLIVVGLQEIMKLPNYTPDYREQAKKLREKVIEYGG